MLNGLQSDSRKQQNIAVSSDRTWHINLGITRWNDEPLKVKGFPDLPLPFSPIANNQSVSGKQLNKQIKEPKEKLSSNHQA